MNKIINKFTWNFTYGTIGDAVCYATDAATDYPTKCITYTGTDNITWNTTYIDTWNTLKEISYE